MDRPVPRPPPGGSTPAPSPGLTIAPGLVLTVGLAAVLALATCAADVPAEPAEAAQEPAAVKLTIGTRAGKVRLFPCQQCHDKIEPGNPSLPLSGKHRNLEFDHYEGMGNCYVCHDAANMDRLRLLTEESISQPIRAP